MLISTKIHLVGFPKILDQGPFPIYIFICLQCMNLKFEYRVISIQRLGVVVGKVVSERIRKEQPRKQKSKHCHYTIGRKKPR